MQRERQLAIEVLEAGLIEQGGETSHFLLITAGTSVSKSIVLMFLVKVAILGKQLLFCVGIVLCAGPCRLPLGSYLQQILPQFLRVFHHLT
ncbi:hypothetical protein D3C72_2165180 [compost metagenome]